MGRDSVVPSDPHGMAERRRRLVLARRYRAEGSAKPESAETRRCHAMQNGAARRSEILVIGEQGGQAEMKMREIREKHDLTRPQAAGLIGKSKRTVQDWELDPNKQDAVTTDYLLMILGDLTPAQARKRALARIEAEVPRGTKAGKS
jgi:DNA-binding transcriptional regulator YiaG